VRVFPFMFSLRDLRLFSLPFHCGVLRPPLGASFFLMCFLHFSTSSISPYFFSLVSFLYGSGCFARFGFVSRLSRVKAMIDHFFPIFPGNLRLVSVNFLFPSNSGASVLFSYSVLYSAYPFLLFANADFSQAFRLLVFVTVSYSASPHPPVVTVPHQDTPPSPIFPSFVNQWRLFGVTNFGNPSVFFFILEDSRHGFLLPGASF